MITFFRKIRQSQMNQNQPERQANKVSRYLVYSIGEVLLVVVGILLALAINEWNTERKNQAYLSVMLKEIHKDLKSDQTLIFSGIEPRLKNSEKGVENMKRRLHDESMTFEDGFGSDYGRMGAYFNLTTTSGSYDALKSKGIEIIKNDSLRLSIFEFYETIIPRALTFIHGRDENILTDVNALENEILDYETEEDKNGKIRVRWHFKDPSVFRSQTMYKIVGLNSSNVFTKRYRLDKLKADYARVSLLLEEELSQRSIPFTSFDSTQVKPDF